jgi:putative ABC transport system permease protein
MIAIIARSLWARKRRLVTTLLAVAFGVAFLAGTLLLSDTLRANFDRLFTRADGGTNVVLRGATEIGSGNSARTGVDASLLPRVQTVPGVADAQPYLFLVLGAVTGILAGIRPARRAARLNMISAITAA